MAENIDVTPGTGATIAADDVAGVKYQQIKIVDGTADSTTPITATGGALDINIKSGNPTTIIATQGTASNLKVEATIAGAQTLAAVTAITNDIGIKDNGNSITVDNGGTFAVQGTVVGTIADDAATAADNPVMIGGTAVETDGTSPGSVSAEGDVVRATFTRNRRLLVSTVHPDQHSTVANYTSAQTDTEIIAAPGANLSLYITDIIVSNGATAGIIWFEEDTTSAKTQKTLKLYPAINGGMSTNFQQPIRCTTNKNFGITSTTVTTHSVQINYFIAP
jgi:hypothetical protein